MKWALIDSNNVAVNIIVYDGQAAYQPPQGLSLGQVNNWVQMGDRIDKPEPQPEPEKTPEELKAEKVEALKGNLALVAVYDMEKKSNPDLDFGDYIDSLDAKSKGM